MTDELDALRTSVVAAVQQELTRYNEIVSVEIQRLRAEITAERAARARTEEQLLALMPAVERSHAANAAFQTDIQRALEGRLSEFATTTKRRHEEMEVRIGRIADEANLGLAAAVESAAQPIVKQLEFRQDRVESELVNLDRSVRRFDDQAAKIVSHINDITEATEARIDEVSAQVVVEIDGRLAALATRVDEVSAQAARQQAEVSNIVGSRVDQAEVRINDRLITTEARINETVGERIADIDAYVGRVSVGLDESVIMLSDRLAGADARFEEVNRSIDALGARVDAVDVDAIDDMKDRMGSVAGEVELIRIETERFQESMGQTMDKSMMRIVELETQLQEQHLDVETAVQLERLEEVERALIALDPSQFVRRTDAGAAVNGTTSYDNTSNGHSATGFDDVGEWPLADPADSPAVVDVSPSASTPFSAPTPFSPPVNAQH